MKNRVCAVIVTYNRLEKLKKTLLAYEKQTEKPYSIIIFDNNSNDGTVEYLQSWKERNKEIFDIDLYFNDKNEGGAGGFNKALGYALHKDCDWIWISDDDAYPEPNAFECLDRRLSLVNSDIGAVCSTVIQGGQIAPRHRRRIKTNAFTGISEICVDDKEYRKDIFDLNLYTFVGTCLRKTVLSKVGLPNKDYFIWYDDTEHSMRVNHNYRIICDPKIVVVHDVPAPRKEKTWKGYYANRNRLYAYSNHLSVKQFKKYMRFYKAQIFIAWFIDKHTYKVKKQALSDFKNNYMGISDIYKPGSRV